MPVKSLADLGRLLQEKQEYERRWALRDQQNGIRCILHCGPCDTLRLTEQPVTQFHPDRGYAPEYIRRSTGITGVYFVYRWRKRLEAVVRSSSDKGPMYQPAGFYIYDFVGRQGRSTDLRYDDALLVFQGGPLHEQTQWIPNPAEETIPVNRTAQGVSYGKAYKRSDGEYVCTGRVKIRLAARDSTETGKELWLKAVATPGAELGYYPEAFFTGGVSQLLPGTLYAHQHNNVYQLTTGSEIYERALLERLKREASAAVSRLLFYKVKPDVWDEIRTERRYNGIWGASTGGERHVLQGAFGLICKYRGGRLELYYGTSRITSLVDYEQAQSV